MASPAFADTGPFVSFPCQDGWMACLVGGERVEPGPQIDARGRPSPADLRVGWFDLQASPTFSPFVELSEYPIQVAPSPVPAAVAPAPPPPVTPTPLPPVAPREPVAVAPAAVDPAPVSVRPQPAPVVAVAPEPEPGPAPVVATAPEPEPAPVAPAPAPEPAPVPAEPVDDDAVVMVDPDVPPSEPRGCDVLTELEMQALLGKLSTAQRDCLNGRIAASSERMTSKDKVSRVLLADAFARGDRDGQIALLERHLEEIDQSDPDLALRMAQLQMKDGRATQTIRWADVALENRTVWTGATYVHHVSLLYKLRAAAAQTLWKRAEQTWVDQPSDAAKAAVSDARDRTKVYAREWYEYTKEAGQDTSQALDLCVSAAGTRSYCEAL